MPTYSGICGPHPYTLWYCIVQAHLIMGMPRHAVESLEEMKANGRRPSATSYALAIDACRDDPSLAWKYFKEAQTSGQELSTGIFNSLLKTFSRHGEQYISHGLEVLRDMENNGPSPNTITYNSILHGLSEYGRCNEAFTLVQERMVPRGISPDVYSVSSLLHACAKAADLTAEQTINQVHTAYASSLLFEWDDKLVRPVSVGLGARHLLFDA